MKLKLIFRRHQKFDKLQHHVVSEVYANSRTAVEAKL